MGKKSILIVEDEWIIYDELASFLSKKDFEIAPYTKSFDGAINKIKLQMPDMVLLDINLQGDKDGIDLGEELSSKYHIPFIYLSAYSDEVIVNRARRTNPDTFLIKTKPNIDKEQLYVAINMAISKTNRSLPNNKDGIFVYTDYYRDTTETGHNELKKILLRFDDIHLITTDNTKRNYITIHTKDSISHLRNSLSSIKEILPFHFVRINNSEIINLKKVEGKINHSSFKINDNTFKIGPNYSDEVHKVLHSFYYE
jgi:DNA-binding LytR/AlgR family response regulator